MTDPVTTDAQFLQSQLDWLRHALKPDGTPVAVDVFREIGECAARMRSLVEGPREQLFLGPCGAAVPFERCEASISGVCLSMTEGFATCDEGECVHTEERTCDGDVYGVPGAEKGRCKTCGAAVDQDQRRAWLDDVVRDYAYTAAEIAEAYGLNVNTIRTWLRRGLLMSRGRWGKHPLLNLGEVLDLAAESAARREEARAQRQRRREAAEMGA